MESVPVKQAVGMTLCHDVTQIVPDLFKGPAFRKGHIIQEEDVPKLLEIGKEHIYVAGLDGGIHEDAAAERIARAAAGGGLALSDPCEGKVNFTATRSGLLKIDVDALNRINTIPDIMFATLHGNRQVTEGTPVAGTRIIPLTIPEPGLEQVEAVCQEAFPLLEIKPFRPHKVGLVTTGSEIYNGRIKDGFGPVLEKKFEKLNSAIFRQILVSDDMAMTVDAIHELIHGGAEMIAVTGGMSVDPDDRTPASIRAAGGSIVTYGAPVLPGAMFMLAHIGKIPVIGLPGCVMFYRASIFDLVVPRLLAGEEVTGSDITAMGHGGFCSNCKVCRYPACSFGK
ncbi:MAG: molybdopterin-binding protein [Desulfobacteraceae bacterium]